MGDRSGGDAETGLAPCHLRRTVMVLKSTPELFHVKHRIGSFGTSGTSGTSCWDIVPEIVPGYL